MQHVRAVVFDAYGTLLDLHAAMRRYAGRLGPNWQQISADWRMKQVEYSWVRSLAGAANHRDFWRLTEEALVWAAARHDIHDAELLAEILMAYRHLEAYPEVPVILRQLRDKGLPRAILSNGEPGMLRDAVHTAGLTDLLNAVLSVESVGVFKPDPRVYQLAGAHFGLAASQMAFVSSNPWDAFGAHAFGFKVVWVNRTSQRAEYDLHGKVTEIRDLTELTGLLAL
jgi:2-haloacid dehalogenase